MSNIQKVDDFLSKAQVFYLATVDGDKPKCRPLGFHMVAGDTLYMGVGDFKEVYRQMQANPYVEICATAENDFIRYYGKAVFEPTQDLAKQVLANAPFLQQIYNEETGHKLEIFHLEDATAEFRSITGAVTESYTF